MPRQRKYSKPGRPKLPDDEKASCSVLFKLTPQEKQNLDNYCTQHGIRRNTLMRQIVSNAICNDGSKVITLPCNQRQSKARKSRKIRNQKLPYTEICTKLLKMKTEMQAPVSDFTGIKHSLYGDLYQNFET